MSTHEPTDAFVRHELSAFTAFRKTGDVLGMLTLAGHCDDAGETGYAAMIRLVCDPPNMFRERRATRTSRRS